MNAIQFIALLEVLRECAEHVPAELGARVKNLLDYHTEHDTASTLAPRKWDEGEQEGCGIDSQRAFIMKKHDETMRKLKDWVEPERHVDGASSVSRHRGDAT